MAQDKTIQVRITQELYRKIAEAARKDARTISSFMRAAAIKVLGKS